MGRVAQRIAIVTGAAKGIGAETARLLAFEGARVVCTDLDETQGEAIAGEIRHSGGEALFIRQDVTSEEDWQNVMALARGRFGGLHILVNNAGISPPGKPVEKLELAEWRRTLSVDLDSVFLGCKHAIPLMKQGTRAGGPGCSIINMSSAMGLVGNPFTADYNSAKAGVRMLSKCVALECAQGKYNIRVNSVHPGYIDTPMIQGTLESQGRHFGGAEELMKHYVSLHPIGRLGTAADIANMVLFLASDESAFVTGADFAVDGGYTAQ